jgi:hypothetical protein
VGGNKRRPVSPFFLSLNHFFISFDPMKRRLKSLTCVHACGWTAICEENKVWHLPFGATEWIKLPDLPPISEPPNAGLVTREEAERLCINSIEDRNIDTGCVLRSLIEEIRNELGLPRPGKAAQ